MEHPAIVAALQAHLAEVERVRPLPYDGPERKGWEKAAVQLLQDAYGERSRQLESFLSAPLGKLAPRMPRAEWQENYDYLLGNQAKVLQTLLARAEAGGPVGNARIGVVGRPAASTGDAAEEMPEHFLLDAVGQEHKFIPEALRTAIVGLENLLKANAPWPDVRQQVFVVLAADRPIAFSVLRALPNALHLCTRDH